MGSFSIWHWMVVLAIVLIFFGAGRLPAVAGDLAKGIKNFKAGMRDGEVAPPVPVSTATADPVPVPLVALPRPLPGEAARHADETARG